MGRRRSDDPMESRTLSLRRSTWGAVDAEVERRGTTRSALFGRLLERAGIGAGGDPAAPGGTTVVARAERLVESVRPVPEHIFVKPEVAERAKAVVVEADGGDELDARMACGHPRVFASGGRCRRCGSPA